MLKKLAVTLITMCITISVFVPINAETNIDEEGKSRKEYYNELLKSKSSGEELPLPSEDYLREDWIDMTSSILESRNQGIHVSNIITDDHSVTFIFDPIQIQQRILINSYNKNAQEITYLGSVSYEEATPFAASTRTAYWYNSEPFVNVDGKTLKDLSNLAGITIAILGLGFSNRILAISSVIQAAASFCNVTMNNNLKTIVTTNVQNGYTTKQVSAYSVSWIPGAQVQRHEQFTQYIVNQYKSNGDGTNSAIKTNYPNSTHSNYDACEKKEHYDDDALQERARQVATGNNTLYYNVYKDYIPNN